MQHIHKSFLTLAVAVLLAGTAVTPATADWVSYTFTGTLDPITYPSPFLISSPPFTQAFTGMEAVSGTITYNDAKSDFFPDNPNLGQYTGAVKSVTLNIGATFQATLGDSGTQYIQIADNGFGDQAYVLRAPLTGPSLLGDPTFFGQPTQFAPLFLLVNLEYGTSSPFTGDALGTPSLNAILPTPTFRVYFEDAFFGQPFVAGTISSITAVPLPPAVMLFGAGLVALIGLGARNWHQARGSPGQRS